MTPEEIKLNMPVMTSYGKGIVVGWSEPDSWPYLVKIEVFSGHNGQASPLIAGSNKTLDKDGRWFAAEQLTAIEETTHYPDWAKLTPLPSGPRPYEKEWTKFVVIDGGHFDFKKGDIVELIENDGTPVPYFKRTNECERLPCRFSRLAPLPQHEEKKMKKLIPFTDEFDWCEDGVLVNVEGVGERYAVRAKGGRVWTVDGGVKPFEVEFPHQLSTYSRHYCQKVIHEEHRQLTNREFAEFLQDHKGMVKDTVDSMICYNFMLYDCENENKSARDDILFRFRGSEEWLPITTELYEIAKELNS